MTAVIGYIYKDTANIVADSAVTFTGKSRNEKDTTPFGENFYNDESKSVTDRSHKICNIGRDVLAAFAGLVSEGRRTLDDLFNWLSYAEHRPVSRVLGDYFKQNKLSDTEYIFAFRENGRPKIIYNSREMHGTITNDDWLAFFRRSKRPKLAMIGSIRDSSFDFLRLELLKGVRDAWAYANTPMEALITIIGIAQLFAINYPKLDNGVGGTFNGAVVDRKGVKWAADTVYTVYSSKNLKKVPPFYVTKYNRDGGVVVGRNGREVNVFLPEIALKSITVSDWVSKWGIETKEMHKVAHAEYFIMLSTDRLIIVVVGPSHISDAIQLRVIKGEPLEAGFDERLMEMMLRKDVVDDSFNPALKLAFYHPHLLGSSIWER